MRIHIRTPSRLHFGIIDLSGSLGRRYGSAGLAIDGLGYEILAEISNRMTVTGPLEDARRAREIAKKVTKIYNISGKVKINILRSIPMHVGLGSTTQITLALSTAITRLFGKEISPVELAERLGRGKNSGVGTYAFVRGGFIVDGGVKEGKFPPLIFRRDFPEEWRFVIVIPKGVRRMDEKTEEGLFKKITAPANAARTICHLLIMKMLPSILEHDVVSFGQALTEAQRLVGKTFSHHQGGIFSSRLASEITDRMLKDGAYGVGQSSWGPTVYGLADGESHARELSKSVLEFLRDKNIKASFAVVGADNKGAIVEVKG